MGGDRVGSNRAGRVGASSTPSSLAAWLFLAVALAAAVLVGRVVAHEAELLHLPMRVSLEGAAALIVLVSLCAALLRHAEVGVVLLVGFVYLNLSQVLVRFHGLPSLLQLMVLPLLIAVVARQENAAQMRRALLSPLSVLLAAYVVLLGLSGVLAQNTELADERFFDSLKALVLCGLVASLLSNRSRIRAACWTLIGCGSLLAGLTIYQASMGIKNDAFGGLARVKLAHIYGRVFETRLAGPLGDPNFFAQILLILVPIALFMAWSSRSLRLRILAYTAAGLVTAATLLTYSRGGALALACVIGLSILGRGVSWRRMLVGALAGVLLLSVVTPGGFTRRLQTLSELLPGGEVLHPDSSLEKRKLLAQVAWRLLLDHPLVGVGAGNYSVYYNEYADEVGSVAREYVDPDVLHFPHNLYLEVGAETGLVGLAVFAAILVAAVGQLRFARSAFLEAGDRGTAYLARAIEIGIVGYLVSSIFLHGDFQRYLWLWFAFSTALYAVASTLVPSPAGRGQSPLGSGSVVAPRRRSATTGGTEPRALTLISSLRTGGAERVTVSFLKRLAAGPTPAVLCTVSSRQDGPLASELEAHGIERRDLTARRLADPLALVRLLRLLRRERFQLVHAHGQDASILALAARRLLGVPLIVTRHVLDERATSWRWRLRARLALKAAREADTLIAVSVAVADRLAKTAGVPRDAVQVVHNGVELERFHPALTDAHRSRLRRDLDCDERTPLVLVPSVLRRGKGHDVLLSAIPIVQRRVPEACFWLAGGGELETELEALAGPHGEAVRLLGERQDMPELLAASDLVVLPSLSEALPTVLMEAAAVGRPVVATRVGGTSEVVLHERTGLLVEPNDPQGLAEAITKLLTDRALAERFGRAGRLLAEERFSVERQLSQTLRIWSETVAAP